MLRLRVRDPSGCSHTVSLQQHATLGQLRAAIQQLTAVQPATQQLLIGFPPQPLQSISDEQLLTACGVHTGDTLTVALSHTGPATSGGGGGPTGRGGSSSLTPVAVSLPPPSPLCVAAMADDNSCLFHAISYCVSGRSSDGLWGSVRVEASEMRQLVAASILSLAADSDPSARLPSTSSASASSSAVSAYIASLPSVSSYAASIERSDVWGGALECAVLSDAFGCRIHAVDVENGTL